MQTFARRKSMNCFLHVLLLSLLFLQRANAMLVPGDQQPSDLVFNFMALPHDVRRIIQMMALQEIPQKELKDSLANLANFARSSKSFHAFINVPCNTKVLLKEMGRRIKGKHELAIAAGLKNMPGVKSDEVQNWIKQREQQIPLEEKLRWNDDCDTLDQLIAQGVDINAHSNANGITPFMQAVCSDFEISYIQKLLELGVSANIPCKDGKTPLMYAIILGRSIEYIQELLKYAKNLDHKDEGGLTALMHAIAGRLDAVRMAGILIIAGADVTVTDKRGQTALAYALEQNNLNLIKVLLECNPKTVNARDGDGETVLMKSIDKHHGWPDRAVEIVKLILEKNPDLSLRDEKGRTALERAKLIEEDAEMELSTQRIECFVW